MSNQPIGGIPTRRPYIRCIPCRESDCEMCTRIEGECTCSCWTNYLGEPVPKAIAYWVPQAGSIGRKKWLGRHAPILTEEIHLHVQLVKGVPRWVVSVRGSSICQIPGRCKKVKIADISD